MEPIAILLDCHGYFLHGKKLKDGVKIANEIEYGFFMNLK